MIVSVSGCECGVHVSFAWRSGRSQCDSSPVSAVASIPTLPAHTERHATSPLIDINHASITTLLAPRPPTHPRAHL